DAVMGKKHAESSLACRFKAKYGEDLEIPDPAVALIPSVELWPETETEKARINGKTDTKVDAKKIFATEEKTSDENSAAEEEIVIEEPIVAPKSSKFSGFWLGWASFKFFPLWEFGKRAIGTKTRGQFIARVILELVIGWLVEPIFFILLLIPRVIKAIGRGLEARRQRKYAEEEGLLDEYEYSNEPVEAEDA
ncbi:MAG: hypothetical protein QXT63_06745, partial [Thermoplasmata archaeon]